MRKTGNFFSVLKIFFLLLFFTISINFALFSEDIEVTAGVDAQKIGLDDSVVFTVTMKGINNPSQPDLSKLRDFKIVQSSRSSEFKFINGSSSSYIHFSYYLMPMKIGKLEIPSIIYSYRGKNYSTPKFLIEVVDGSVKPRSNRRRSVDPFAGFDEDFSPFFSQGRNKPESIDIKVKANVSKKSVFKGEQLVYTVKLYTRNRVESVNMLSKQSFAGFWQEWYQVKESIESKTEYIDNKKYNVYEIRKAVLFPNESGLLTIPPVRFEMRLGLSAFSMFSNGGRVIRSTKPIKINVKEIPKKAVGLPVGDFSFSVNPVQKKVDINSFLTVVMQVKGSGNIKIINLPFFESGRFYKVFQGKVSRENMFSDNGINGIVRSEIQFSFKKDGRITIPALSFTYFDPKEEKIKIKKSLPFFIDVTGNKEINKGVIAFSGDSVEREGVDIDYIKKGSINDQENFLYKNKYYKILLIVPFLFSLCLIIYLFVLNKYIFKSKVFLKQKNLNGILKELRSTEDFGLIYKIIERYLTENTSLSKSNLSSENIEDFLYKLNLAKSDIDSFIKIFKNSESYKFSPEKRSEKDLKNENTRLIEIIKKIHRKL